LLVFLAATGCSLLVAKPGIAVKEVQFAGVDRDGIEMAFLVAVTNPNSYGLTLTGYHYNLLVSALPLAQGENHETVEFKGNAVTNVRLPFRISFHDLQQILKRRTDSGQIPYQLTAGFDLDTPVGSMRIPVSKSGTFAVPKKFRPDLFLKLFE
jgi:LEA14-like dessication related protein